MLSLMWPFYYASGYLTNTHRKLCALYKLAGVIEGGCVSNMFNEDFMFWIAVAGFVVLLALYAWIGEL